MKRYRPTIIIAETAPIINSGLVDCFSRLTDSEYDILSAPTPARLSELAARHPEAIFVVNPLFGGAFDPSSLRNSSETPIKIIAIETSPFPRNIRRLYDGTLPVTDDFETIKRRITEVVTPTQPADNDKETLTSREKDIITHVVKGLTNKEIADKLFLSVHTVMTHRRNIARKLEIHSATGLTIYAIVNGLVDLSEIKL